MAEGERRIAMAAQFDLLRGGVPTGRGPGRAPRQQQQQQQQVLQQQQQHQQTQQLQQQALAQQQQNQRQALSGLGIGMGLGAGGQGTPRLLVQGAPLTRSHSHGGFVPLRRSSATTMDEYFSNIEEGNDNEDEGLFF